MFAPPKRSGAVGAAPDEVEAVLVGPEAVAALGLHDRGRHRPFERGRRRQVDHDAASLADEVVVMAGQILRELVSRELVVRDDPVHDAGLFQHDEVAVHRALREPRPLGEDLGDRERPVGGRQHLEQGHAAGGEALAQPPQAWLRDRSHVGPAGHAGRSGRAAHRAASYRRAVPSVPMDARERFEELLALPELPLASAALCIAACARPDADVDGTLSQLDAFARAVRSATLDDLVSQLYSVAGFAGDRQRYEHPRNSMLDLVVARRRGIPITLAVVLIEVGDRSGVALEPIGMPGHFLVRSVDDTQRYCDPFEGTLLDPDGCRRIFEQIFGPDRSLRSEDLAPVSRGAVVARMLNNLEAGSLGRDLAALDWMLDLHQRIPGLGAGERVALATRLELLGRYDDAARQIDLATPEVDDRVRERLAARGRMYRAKWN